MLQEGLKPVLCLGETQAEYEAGLNQEVSKLLVSATAKPYPSRDIVGLNQSGPIGRIYSTRPDRGTISN